MTLKCTKFKYNVNYRLDNTNNLILLANQMACCNTKLNY